MSTVTFVKKTPAGGGLGNFNYTYKCKCTSGTEKGEIVVTSANDGEAKKLAQLECDEKCGEV